MFGNFTFDLLEYNQYIEIPFKTYERENAIYSSGNDASLQPNVGMYWKLS